MARFTTLLSLAIALLLASPFVSVKADDIPVPTSEQELVRLIDSRISLLRHHADRELEEIKSDLVWLKYQGELAEKLDAALPELQDRVLILESRPNEITRAGQGP